ncbi:MAG: chemotaxis protein [Anaerolineae bacterium]|nr:chemotaxis protein [Anaerolineae bacterium]
MGRKIAVMVIHGVGKQTPDFAARLTEMLFERCRPECGDDLVIESAYWAPVTQIEEDRLWQRVLEGGELDFLKLRRFLVDFMADAIAYQPTPNDRKMYDAIHSVLAETMQLLAVEAGPDAPLIIVGHSLGTIIASNFIYDLQMDAEKHLISEEVRAFMSDTPLEKGETLTSFFTMGSPIALWSLRYREFGRPISIPSPTLREHFAFLPGEWLNFYDADDVVAYPLKSLNKYYAGAITQDVEVNVGGFMQSWNPLSHLCYWTDQLIIERIAASLIATWRYLNLS